MTTTALNYSLNLLDGFLSVLKTTSNGIKKTLQGVMIGMMVARQTKANEYVAEEMIRYGEYRKDDYYHLLHELNKKTIDRVHKEVTGE